MASFYMVVIDYQIVDADAGKIRFNWGTSFDQSTGEIIKLGTCPSIGMQTFYTAAFPDILDSGSAPPSISDFYVTLGGPSIASNTQIGAGGYLRDANLTDSSFSKASASGSSLGDFRSGGLGTSYAMFSASSNRLQYTLAITGGA